jgi:voltage-gated potassium channel
MTATPVRALSPAKRRRLIAGALLRALTATTVLVALYYVLPLDHFVRLPLAVSLTSALLILFFVTLWWVLAIIRAPYPAVRAIEALATTVPLFLLVFATTYFLLEQSDPDSFSTLGLTRSDALYFTVTVFSTVGFGDIVATSQTARLLVTTQMILDLLILGLGIQAFIGAVRVGRKHQTQDPKPAPGDLL